MARVMSGPRPPIAAAHLRKDAWWALPVTVVIVLGSFIVYSTWAAFQNAHYYAAPYLSPFYSPCLAKSCVHPTFGGGLPDISLPIIGIVSPAFLILWGPGPLPADLLLLPQGLLPLVLAGPGGLRRARREAGYTGETRFPLILQNSPPLRLVRGRDLHRHPDLGRAPGLPLPGARRRPSVRHRRGHPRHVDQRDPARRLHLLLPLLPPRVRRPRRRVLAGARRATSSGASSRGSTSGTRCSRGSRCSAWA